MFRKLKPILNGAMIGGSYLGICTGLPAAIDEIKEDKPYRAARALLSFGVYGIAGGAVGASAGGAVGLVKVACRSVKSRY